MRARSAGMALAVWLASGASLAAPCAGFTDVDSSSGFCVNVAWLKSHNITLGCTATTYCPNDAVSRLQMAAFMNRLGNITFIQGGNAFGAVAQLGTTDLRSMEIIANNKRGFRIEPNAANIPNVFGGYENNSAYPGVLGATVAGGGGPGILGCSYAFGCQNSVTDNFGTIGGGYGNLAGDTDGDLGNGPYATVSGGLNNAATDYSFVGGGSFNQAIGDSSVSSGGYKNVSNGYASTIPGGYSNQASGGQSFVAGGNYNVASGAVSFASGSRAHADADGCVVFANGNSNLDETSCGGPNRFVVRAYGGYYLFTAGGSAGAYLAPGVSAWSVISDRNAKTDVVPVDTRDVLERLAAIPMSTWRWSSEPGSINHMGPMAQDFYAAFKLGDSDKRIVTVDADGVALAAIQALHSRSRDSEAAVYAKLAEKDAKISALELRLEKIEALLAH